MFTMFIIFAPLMVACLAMLCLDFGSYLTFSNFMLNGSWWGVVCIFDSITLSVLLMLSVCFGYALFYTMHYFSGDFSGLELNKLICLFVSVMATLVVTGDFLSTLILWEYLGVVSYFLILFYLSYLSLRSSVVTLVSSRFGDVCLFIVIAVSGWVGGSNTLMWGTLLYFIIFTKSAGFPFISWLLEAMRAPTPVSSLVHSSTLVAAGVWFAMRYNIFCFISNVLLFSLLLLLTIFITGVCCFFFIDLKKIVALSTCNNISWCIFYLLFGDVTLALFQLVSHGVSKCLLFMLVGDVMSGSGGSQASNCVYSPRLYGNWGVFGLFSIILGLSGVPFIGVFFTKHFLLCAFGGSLNVILTTFVIFCVFLSYFYSFRLCRILINVKSSTTSGVLFAFNSGLMVYFWLFINYFIASILDESTALSSNISLVLILFQLVSCLTAYLIYNSVWLSNWSSSLFGCDNLVESFYKQFINLRVSVSLFFFRWDHQLLLLFNGGGQGFVNLLNNNLLNIILMSIFIFLSVWLCIV